MDAGQGVCPVCNKFQTTNANELQRHASACGDKSRLRRLSRFASGPVVPAAQANIGKSSQKSAQPADAMLAKSCDCCAVVGQVCWFCLKSEPHLTRSLLGMTYGDLPIWYHPACIDGLAEHTDSSLFTAYKAQAAGRSAAAMHTSSVSLSAMRSLSNAWLRKERQQETLVDNSTTRSDDDDQRAGEEDPGDDSEDDATPLLHLAKKPRVSDQLAARRTPFLNQAIEPSASDKFASPKLAETPLPACPDSIDRKTSRSFRPPTQSDCVPAFCSLEQPGQHSLISGPCSARPSPFANKAVMQNTPSGSQQYPASQIFGDRPGFSWESSGYVTEVPPVRSDEKRVLSHHMSPRVTEMYKEAQDGAALVIKVLQFYEECGPGEWDRNFRELVKTNVKQYLQKDMARRNVRWLLPNLPEDPDCSHLLEVRPVQEGDFREGLRPGIDVTVHAKAGIPAGAVLGLYRNITVNKSEERTVQDNPPDFFEGTTNEWCQKLDAYTADIEQPKPSFKQSRRTFGNIYEEALKNKPLACLAYMTGNILSCINDGCARPFRGEDEPWTEDQPEDRPANVALVAVAVGNWPFMFVVATNEIAAGEELFLSYGAGFWTFQNDSFRAIKREKQREWQLEQKWRASRTLSVDSQGGSQLHKARSGPPMVETAMSANHAYSGPVPYKPMEHAATAPTANLKEEKVAHEDLGVPLDENDRQEAAADNQQELQQHQSKDGIGDLQQPQIREDAAAVDDPGSAAHDMPEIEDAIAPIIKKAKTEVANSPSRSRLARPKEFSSAPAMLPQTAAIKRSRRPVSKQPDRDMDMLEAAIMQGSSISQPLHGYDSENGERRCWAPLACTDFVSMAAFIQGVHYSVSSRSQRCDSDSSLAKVALFAPDRKQLHACRASLDRRTHNSSKPDGAGDGQGAAKHQARHVSNAVDQTHPQSPPGQSIPLAAQQDHPGQARLLPSGAEQGNGLILRQQRRLCRIGSTTGSTQLATSLLGGEAAQQADATYRDPPLFFDRDESNPCDPKSDTHPGQRPVPAALSKLKSVYSRSKAVRKLSTAAANAPGQGNTAAAPAKAARKKRREQSCERPAHTAGPSRLGSSKFKQAAAKQSAVPAVNAHSDSKTDSRPSGSGLALGTVSTQADSVVVKGQVAEHKVSHRPGVNIMKVGQPGHITTMHSASFGLRKSTDGRNKARA